jgi:hypothetical protein
MDQWGAMRRMNFSRVPSGSGQLILTSTMAKAQLDVQNCSNVEVSIGFFFWRCTGGSLASIAWRQNSWCLLPVRLTGCICTPTERCYFYCQWNSVTIR